jgi:hypothetical protein
VSASDTAQRWSLTFFEAAVEVLRQEERALSTRELTDLVLAKKLVRTRGRTPRATMSAALYSAPADSPIHREYELVYQRARQGSVRWRYVGSE